jgi:hypothetical protein
VRTGSTRAALLALALSAAALAGAPAAHGAPRLPARSIGAFTAAKAVVAVHGAHDALYANQPGSTAMHNLGGHLIGAPAVAFADGRYFFVTETIGGALEIRTEKSSWAPMVRHSFTCSQPDLASNGSALAVACLHHKALYAAKLTVPAHGLPRVSKLKNQGGRYSIGAAVSFVGNQVWLEVIGPHYDDDLANYDTYNRPLGGTANSATQDDQFNCAATPAEPSEPNNGSVFAGCAVRAGKTRHLEYTITTANSSGGGASSRRIPADRIGLAPTSVTSAILVYQNARGDLIEQTVTDSASGPTDVSTLYQHGHDGAAVAVGAAGYR